MKNTTLKEVLEILRREPVENLREFLKELEAIPGVTESDDEFVNEYEWYEEVLEASEERERERVAGAARSRSSFVSEKRASRG
jgi:hypothetical protein